MAFPRRKCEANPVYLVEGTGSESADVDIAANTSPRVGNAPASPGAALVIADDASHEVTVANLVAGAVYELILLPTTPTDFIRGVFKCAAAGGSVGSLTDGWPLFANSPERICLPTGSTKVRLYFMRDPSTPLGCTVYLSRTDA